MKEERLTQLVLKLFEECKAIYEQVEYRNYHSEELNKAIQNVCKITAELAYLSRFNYGEKVAQQTIRLSEELLKAYISLINVFPEKFHEQAKEGGQG